MEEFTRAVDSGPDLLYRRLAEGEARSVAAALVTEKTSAVDEGDFALRG